MVKDVNLVYKFRNPACNNNFLGISFMEVFSFIRKVTLLRHRRKRRWFTYYMVYVCTYIYIYMIDGKIFRFEKM